MSANVNALKKDMNSVRNDIQTLKGTRHVSAAVGNPNQAVTTELRTNMTSAWVPEEIKEVTTFNRAYLNLNCTDN